MKCNLECPFFLTVNHSNYALPCCRLEQSYVLIDKFWKSIPDWNKDMECISNLRRINKMKELIGI